MISRRDVVSCHVGTQKGNDSAFIFRQIRRTTHKEQFEKTWAGSLWKKIELKNSQDKNNTQPLNSWPLNDKKRAFMLECPLLFSTAESL